MLPDLDHFVPYAPRIVFHNVFMLVPPLAIALYGLATKRAVFCDFGLLASFCLLSHLVLDFFNETEALFYPLTTARYGFAGRPALFYQIWTHEFLPKLLWPYTYVALGIMLSMLAFAGVLVVKRLFQLNTKVPGSVQTRT